MTFYPKLHTYIGASLSQFDHIASERKKVLGSLREYIHSQLQMHKPVNLIFICTHNSRRSHFAQIWARTAAAWYRLPNIHTFSGGTEATAFNPRAVAALKRAGFVIEKSGAPRNPRYTVRFTEQADPMVAFSKVFDQPPNPTTDFCAVMTCSQAAEACPVVPGASMRINLPYDDPKDHDGTPDETAAYDDRCRQICTEIFYVFSPAQINP